MGLFNNGRKTIKKIINLEWNAGRRTVNKVELNLESAKWTTRWGNTQEEKLINQESKAITPHLLFHVTEPDRAAGPPVDAWQAAELFFLVVVITPSS